MGTIGSYNDKYHVTTDRFEHSPGRVRLELWKRVEVDRYSSDTQRWIDCPEDQTDGGTRVEQAAWEMINAARDRDARGAN